MPKLLKQTLRRVFIRVLRHRAQIALVNARHAYATGDVDGARAIVANALRKHWTSYALWSELGAMMQKPQDFGLLRDLWMSAPARIALSYGPGRAIARAACITGNSDEGRYILRRLINNSWENALRRQSKPAVLKAVAEPVDNFAANAAVALRDLYVAFEDLPVPFLISGTLLGLVREGGFIGWDKDIDVGIFCANSDARAIEDKLRANKFFFVRKVDLTAARIRLVHVNGTMVDVFPHYPDDDGKIIWHDGSATRWWNSPFNIVPAEFIGEKVMIPDNPELYLDENYGDWHTPDAVFDARLDAPNVETTDPEYLLSLHYFSLIDALRKDKPIKQKRYAELLAEIEDDPWFNRFATLDTH